MGDFHTICWCYKTSSSPIKINTHLLVIYNSISLASHMRNQLKNHINRTRNYSDHHHRHRHRHRHPQCYPSSSPPAPRPPRCRTDCECGCHNEHRYRVGREVVHKTHYINVGNRQKSHLTNYYCSSYYVDCRARKSKMIFGFYVSMKKERKYLK